MRRPIRRIAILGPPGVGKGTYASYLAPALGLEHVVVGDLVRSEIRAATPLGRRIAGTVNRGDLVPDGDILELVVSRLCGMDGFILDGMPRTLAQASALDAVMPLDLAIRLDMDEDIIVLKTCARRLGQGDRVYNVAYVRRGNWDMPPRLPGKLRRDAWGRLFCGHDVRIEPNSRVECALCTEGLRAREDDSEEVCRHRLRTYDAVTRPVVDHYAAEAMCLDFVIDGDVDTCAPRLLRLVCELGAESAAGTGASPAGVAARLGVDLGAGLGVGSCVSSGAGGGARGGASVRAEGASSRL